MPLATPPPAGHMGATIPCSLSHPHRMLARWSSQERTLHLNQRAPASPPHRYKQFGKVALRRFGTRKYFFISSKQIGQLSREMSSVASPR